MGQRASPGTLVIAWYAGRNVHRGLSCITPSVVTSILAMFLAAMLISTPVAADLTHHVMLPLIMRSAPAVNSCMGTLPCSIVVRVEDADGNPIQDARIVGLYAVGEDQTTSLSRVTDENGEAVFPGSDREIIFEVQFPVGLLPCPGSPPRIRANPGQTTVRFVGCRM
ncbi:MAG: hypothetical protein ACE5LU_02200 [Anaerolineae bacterium]